MNNYGLRQKAKMLAIFMCEMNLSYSCAHLHAKEENRIFDELTEAHRQGREDGLREAGNKVRLAAGLEVAVLGGDVQRVWDRATATIDSLIAGEGNGEA